VNCQQLRANYLEGAPTPGSEVHLSGCTACRELLPELDRLRRLLSEPALWEAPDDALGHQLDALVAADAASCGLGARPRRGSRRWVAVVAVVAAVMVGAAGLVAARELAGPEPDWELTLESTSSAPGARAIVRGWNEESGTRMELDVEGLPAAGGDEYYAIWLTAPDGRHVPAGTFRATGRVVAWSAVRRADFPRLWITLEANDGDEALSGVTVLDVPA
jgi:hypothetical protein